MVVVVVAEVVELVVVSVEVVKLLAELVTVTVAIATNLEVEEAKLAVAELATVAVEMVWQAAWRHLRPQRLVRRLGAVTQALDETPRRHCPSPKRASCDLQSGPHPAPSLLGIHPSPAVGGWLQSHPSHATLGAALSSRYGQLGPLRKIGDREVQWCGLGFV